MLLGLGQLGQIAKKKGGNTVHFGKGTSIHDQAPRKSPFFWDAWPARATPCPLAPAGRGGRPCRNAGIVNVRGSASSFPAVEASLTVPHTPRGPEKMLWCGT